MVTSFRLIAALISGTPVLILWDEPLVRGLLAGYLAAVLVLIGLGVRPGEGSHLVRVFRPMAIAALLPAIWMGVQILPMPIPALLHPIWLSARDALQDFSLGSITIDIGATCLALTKYVMAVAVVFATAAVTIDRQHADWMLLVLAIVATIVALFLPIRELGGLFFLPHFRGADVSASIDAISGMGVIITTAAAVRAFERFESRHAMAGVSILKFSQAFVFSLIALVTCSAVVLLFAPKAVIFATVCGFGTMVWVLLVRRLGLGLWSRTGVALVGVGAAALVVLNQWAPGNVGLALRFASSSVSPFAARILSEARWVGSGAGTFGALAPIYGGGDLDGGSGFAPTTASSIAIELGRPMLCLVVLIAAFVCFAILRGALERGRDSFYATAAAGGVVLVTLEAFCDASLVTLSASTIAAGLLGLGIAQSASRTVQ